MTRSAEQTTAKTKTAFLDNMCAELFPNKDHTLVWERVASQWLHQFKDEHGVDKIRVARIDVVATTLGRDELQWLDVPIRTPTAVANLEGAARFVGFPAIKPISFELGGRPRPQTVSVLQRLTTKLAETRGREHNAATALPEARLGKDSSKS